jgi:hypothetical protein
MVTKAIRTIIIIIIILKDVLSALVVFNNSRIVANAIYLVYAKFAVELAVVLKSIYLRNKSVRRATLNTYIIINFRRK